MGSQLSTNMSTEKYAIFFPEGDGYLHCSDLGKGSRAVTSVVRSITDNKEYVRKKTKPTAASSATSFGVYSREVVYYREHRLVPRMVRHEDYNVLPQGHPLHEWFKSTSIISTFCNAGTLGRLSNVFFDQQKVIPEELLWHFMDQALEVLDFLHQGFPSVYHADVHLENLFLHFADDAQKFPDLYLGDFGQVHRLDDFIWEISRNPARKALNRHMDPRMSAGIFSDIRMLTKRIYRAILVSRWGFKSPYSGNEETQAFASFSAEFKEVLTRLWDASLPPSNVQDGNNHGEHSERYEQLVQVRRFVSKKAKDIRSSMADLPDLQWTRPGRLPDHAVKASSEKLQGSYEPAFFSSRAELLREADKVPGPWRIARVEASSNKILAVEKLTFGFHLPQISETCLKGCDCETKLRNGQRVEFNWDDHAGIHHLVKTEVDNIGLDVLRAEAAAIVPGGTLSSHFDIDPEWTKERLAPYNT